MRLSIAISCLALFGYSAQSLRRPVQKKTTKEIGPEIWDDMSKWNDGWDPFPDINSRNELGLSTDSVCEQLSKSREFEDNVGVPSADLCELAIIDAGMPRTGSTVVGKIIKAAVRHVNKSTNLHATYWNYHRHIEMSEEQRAKTVAHEKTRISSLGPEGVLIAKIHEFYEPLLSACKKTIIFTTHRHPLDEMNSAVEANWLHSSEEVIKTYDDWITKQQCWINRTKALDKPLVDIDFENYIANTGGLGDLAEIILVSVTSALTGSKPHTLQEFVSQVQDDWGHEATARNAVNCNLPHSNPESCLESIVRDAAERLLNESMYNYTA